MMITVIKNNNHNNNNVEEKEAIPGLDKIWKASYVGDHFGIKTPADLVIQGILD